VVKGGDERGKEAEGWVNVRASRNRRRGKKKRRITKRKN